MPPAAVYGILNMFPTEIINFLKRFVTKKEIIVFDGSFKIATKYTPAVIIILLCICITNEWSSYKDIICHSTMSTKFNEETLEDYCWSHETFLVKKYLTPESKGTVSHPGVGGFDPARDNIIRQGYYNHLWLIHGVIGIANFIPYFIWKVQYKFFILFRFLHCFRFKV